MVARRFLEEHYKHNKHIEPPSVELSPASDKAVTVKPLVHQIVQKPKNQYSFLTKTPRALLYEYMNVTPVSHSEWLSLSHVCVAIREVAHSQANPRKKLLIANETAS